MGKLTVVMGGQYGSEGKGVLVAHIAHEYDYHIRVGSSNAGHSFMYKGVKYKMQMIPCGWKNPNARLVLGRGTLIDMDQLSKEIDEIRKVDPTIIDRLYIDPKAGILSRTHKTDEGGIHGAMHAAIGSTGEGVGAARLARVARRGEGTFHHVYDVADKIGGDGWKLEDMLKENTPAFLTGAYRDGAKIVIEGTQGSGLSLIHGPQWPFSTSADCNAAQMLADVGLSPLLLSDIIMVVRTYPIRVWGNSGPMYKELTFEELSRRLGKEVREYTTVTKKLRRISEWDQPLFEHAIELNQPTQIAVTFLDYLNPEDEGKREYAKLSAESKQFIAMVEKTAQAPVTYMCTGWSVQENDWIVSPIVK